MTHGVCVCMLGVIWPLWLEGGEGFFTFVSLVSGCSSLPASDHLRPLNPSKTTQHFPNSSSKSKTKSQFWNTGIFGLFFMFFYFEFWIIITTVLTCRTCSCEIHDTFSCLRGEVKLPTFPLFWPTAQIMLHSSGNSEIMKASTKLHWLEMDWRINCGLKIVERIDPSCYPCWQIDGFGRRCERVRRLVCWTCEDQLKTFFQASLKHSKTKKPHAARFLSTF